jgi:hypothetical protein
MGYSSIFWLPICAVLTGAGLVLSYYAGRRRGNRAMVRGAAWSLIPIAAYLTGSVEMFWKIGDAIGHFASGFVFSPVKWAGIAVAGTAAVLFITTGGRQRRKAARQKAAERAARKKSAGAGGTQPGLAPAAAIPAASPAGDATTAALPVRKPEPAKPAPANAAPANPAPAKRRGKAPVDDDMRDIEEILRKRGI